MVAVLGGASLVSSYNGFVGLRAEMRSFSRGLDDLLKGRVIEHASESTEMEGCDTRKEGLTAGLPACLHFLLCVEVGQITCKPMQRKVRWNSRFPSFRSSHRFAYLGRSVWWYSIRTTSSARVLLRLCTVLIAWSSGRQRCSCDLLIRRPLLPGSWGLGLGGLF
jgi:hypothetical protein